MNWWRRFVCWAVIGHDDVQTTAWNLSDPPPESFKFECRNCGRTWELRL